MEYTVTKIRVISLTGDISEVELFVNNFSAAENLASYIIISNKKTSLLLDDEERKSILKKIHVGNASAMYMLPNGDVYTAIKYKVIDIDGFKKNIRIKP